MVERRSKKTKNNNKKNRNNKTKRNKKGGGPHEHYGSLRISRSQPHAPFRDVLMPKYVDSTPHTHHIITNNNKLYYSRHSNVKSNQLYAIPRQLGQTGTYSRAKGNPVFDEPLYANPEDDYEVPISHASEVYQTINYEPYYATLGEVSGSLPGNNHYQSVYHNLPFLKNTYANTQDYAKAPYSIYAVPQKNKGDLDAQKPYINPTGTFISR